MQPLEPSTTARWRSWYSPLTLHLWNSWWTWRHARRGSTCLTSFWSRRTVGLYSHSASLMFNLLYYIVLWIFHCLQRLGDTAACRFRWRPSECCGGWTWRCACASAWSTQQSRVCTPSPRPQIVRLESGWRTSCNQRNLRHGPELLVSTPQRCENAAFLTAAWTLNAWTFTVNIGDFAHNPNWHS